MVFEITSNRSRGRRQHHGECVTSDSDSRSIARNEVVNSKEMLLCDIRSITILADYRLDAFSCPTKVVITNTVQVRRRESKEVVRQLLVLIVLDRDPMVSSAGQLMDQMEIVHLPILLESFLQQKSIITKRIRAAHAEVYARQLLQSWM